MRTHSAVTDQGLIRTLTQTLIADPALFPADLLSLYCAKSVLLLWNKTSHAERECVMRVIPIRGNQFGVHAPIFHLTSLYLSPLISPFIIFTLYSQSLLHPDSTLPKISSPFSRLLATSDRFASCLLTLSVFHRGNSVYGASYVIKIPLCPIVQDVLVSLVNVQDVKLV